MPKSSLRKNIEKAISLVEPIKKIERKDGIWPIYPEGLYETLYTLGGDMNYLENHKKIENIEFKNMTEEQLKTYFTWLVRGERFCDGLIAGAIEHGDVLNALKRYKELIDEEC